MRHLLELLEATAGPSELKVTVSESAGALSHPGGVSLYSDQFGLCLGNFPLNCSKAERKLQSLLLLMRFFKILIILEPLYGASVLLWKRDMSMRCNAVQCKQDRWSSSHVTALTVRVL